MVFSPQPWDPEGDLTLILKEQLVSTPSVNNGEQSTVGNELQHEVRMRVSSKHLTLASPVFKAMLTGGFAEAQTLRQNGRLDLPLPEDHPTPMGYLMQIIHSQAEYLPIKLPLEQLAEFAIVVDKYRVHKATKFFTNIWTQSLRLPWTDTDNTKVEENDLVRLNIFWVFGLDMEFKELTAKLIRLGDDTLFDGMDERLPLPKTVIDAIKQTRIWRIGATLDYLNQFIERYQKEQICQLEDCNAHVLGSLIRASVQAGNWPRPSPPFVGKNLQKTAEDALASSVKKSCPDRYSHLSARCEQALNSYRLGVKTWRDSYGGLQLKAYQASSTS